jgi:hypothetical protein
VKSWTRTLNLDDAHTLLALAETGMPVGDWADACYEAIPHVTATRRQELVRILRDGFLGVTGDDRIDGGLFLAAYAHAPATAQIDLLEVQWALTHPITLIATEALVAPALGSRDPRIAVGAVDELVRSNLDTSSDGSIRKTRTVLLGAMEGVGTLTASGSGPGRTYRAARGLPHAVTFGWLVKRELRDRGVAALPIDEVLVSSVAVRLTQCERDHAVRCLDQAIARGDLCKDGDAVSAS